MEVRWAETFRIETARQSMRRARHTDVPSPDPLGTSLPETHRQVFGPWARYRAHTIQVVAFRRFDVRRFDIQAHPYPGVLPRKQEEILKRVEFVAVHARAVGEAAKDLVLPGAFEPGLGGGIREFLKLPSESMAINTAPVPAPSATAAAMRVVWPKPE